MSLILKVKKSLHPNTQAGWAMGDSIIVGWDI